MKLVHGAAERNKGPIADVLARVLPATGTVLELAEGSGQHVVTFAARLPQLRFVPSEPNPEARASIEAHIADSGLTNVAPPESIDVAADDWARPVDAIVCINMVQVVPPETITGLFTGAARCLSPGAPLVLYGPYRRGDDFLSDGNAAFEQTLKGLDPRFGVRDMLELGRLGAAAGFDLEDPIPMPANNHMLVFRRRSGP